MARLLRKPATKAAIARAEKAANLKFNDELTALYSFADGIDVDNTAPSGLMGLIPLYVFMKLEDGIAYLQQMHQFETEYNDLVETEIVTLLPEKVFPFLNLDGDCYWVDLNEESKHYNKVYWTNTLGEPPAYVFNSLTSMFKTIAECYETGILRLNEKGHLKCDYDAWNKQARSNNPGIKYWTQQ